jgi:dolichyl-phosphate beta-glucosyltransferase
MAGSVDTKLRPHPQATGATAAKAATRHISLSVVIPTFNEEERIVDTVSLLAGYLDRQGESYEVIISDDGSHDGGPLLVADEFADRSDVRLIREERNRGKGAAVRRGVLAARGDVIIFTDADLSYPVETIGMCVEALQDYDVVAGSRDLPGSEIEITPPLLRRITGVMFKSLVRKTVLPGFTDTQCGFKGFRSLAAHDIFANCAANGFAFDVEVLALARLFGYSITEMPVRLQLDSSDSTINLTTDPVVMMAELLAIRRRLRKVKSELI